MRKLMFILGLTALSATSFAQWNSRHDHDRNSYDSRGRSEYSDNNWGYDANWNRIYRGGRSNVMINSFQRQSRDRIAEGISRGLITANEAKKLLSYAEKIERKENRFMRNGRLSPSEVRELQSDLAALNRMISREMRDSNRQYNDDRRHVRRF